MDSRSNIYVQNFQHLWYKLTFLPLSEAYKKCFMVTIGHYLQFFPEAPPTERVSTSGTHFRTDLVRDSRQMFGFPAYRSSVFSCNVTVTTHAVRVLTLESNSQINLSDGIINRLANESRDRYTRRGLESFSRSNSLKFIA